MRNKGKEPSSLHQRIHAQLQSHSLHSSALSPAVRPVASESPVKQRRSPPQDPETAASPYEELEEPSPKARSFRHKLSGQSCELTPKEVRLRLSSDGREILHPERPSPKQVSVSLLDFSMSSLISPEQDLEGVIHRLWPSARVVSRPVPRRPPKGLLCVQGDQCTFYELL
jgi:hypothetical protein